MHIPDDAFPFIILALVLSAAACVRWDVVLADRRSDRARDRKIREEIDRLTRHAQR